MQNDAKTPEKCLKPWQIGTHLKVLSVSFQMSTNMTGFRWFQKSLHFFLHWMKVASALEVLRLSDSIYLLVFLLLLLWSKEKYPLNASFGMYAVANRYPYHLPLGKISC